jgi:hypothetical protein
MQDPWNTLRAQITSFSKPFPRAAIELAHAHREAVAPHLVEVLTQVAADPGVAANPDYVLHHYAMHLLAVWRDPRALAPLLALKRYNEDDLDMLLGDGLTDVYGRCLASVCDGRIEPLQALFEDPQAGHWVRIAALHALVVRVLEGDGDRDALVQYLIARGEAEAARLHALEALGEERQYLELIDWIVMAALDLAASGMVAHIDSWFDAGWLDPMMIGSKASLHDDLVNARTPDLSSARAASLRYVRDVEAEIGTWAAFRDEEPASPAFVPVLPVRTTPKVGRNDPCPCGSGKKYKKCCGAG